MPNGAPARTGARAWIDVWVLIDVPTVIASLERRCLHSWCKINETTRADVDRLTRSTSPEQYNGGRWFGCLTLMGNAHAWYLWLL